jgi:amino acid adenylation domain-containing protein
MLMMLRNPDNHLLGGLLRQAALRDPHRIGVTGEGRSCSFAEMHRAATSFAGHLRADGVDVGDRVVLFMGNSVDFVLAFWGAVYSGATIVPVSADTKEQKLRWILEDCRPSAAIVDAEIFMTLHDAAQDLDIKLIVTSQSDTAPLAACLPDLLLGRADDEENPPANLDQNLALIIYTSGSTGVPKGVMLSHLNVLTAARSVAEYLGYRASDSVFCAVPFTFDYGLHQLTMTALVGAELVVERSFAKPFFSLHRLVLSKATVLPLVPTMVALIEPLAARFDLSAIRIVTNTAAALSLRQIAVLRDLFASAEIFSMYGLTECHRCTYLPPALLATHPGSVGRAIPNTELWVVDEQGVRHTCGAIGELVIRGSTVMKGYWQNPEQTDRKLKPGPLPGERVLHTGDICRLDEDGLLYFVARKDDVLKVCGEKVAPREVEDVLLAHPAIAQAAVLGVDDPVLGHKVIAFVEPIATPPIPNGERFSQELAAWCGPRLESHMAPAAFHILAHLPRNGNGKIDKLALSARLAIPLADRTSDSAPEPQQSAPAAALAPGASHNRSGGISRPMEEIINA